MGRVANIGGSMSFRRRVAALCAFFVVALAAAACGSNVPGNSVAFVAGNPLTTVAFKHWMFVAAKGQAQSSPGAPLVVPTDPPGFNGCVEQVRKQVPNLAKVPTKQLKATCKQLFTSLSTQVLDFLIRSYWYQALAAKEHVVVSNAQVQQTFNKDKQQQFGGSEAQFKTFLTQSGQTLQDVLYRVRVNLIYTKLIGKQIKPVTQSAIAAYYNSHKSQYGTQESRDLHVVLTKTSSSAAAALSALKSGQSWTTVAKKYSIDSATKDKGGLLTNVTRGQQDQTLDQAAFSAPVNKLMGPIKSPFGYYIVEVTKINPAKQQSLSQVQSLIRQTLTSQQRSNAASLVDKRARDAYLHQTFCRSPSFVMADCSGYKPPKK
jgi:foldase protein PrsA